MNRRSKERMNNIVLIGMPGAGKSTVGVVLAKILGMRFVDSDILIQEQEGMLLKDIIAKAGIDGYLEIENQVNRDIDCENTVIATGGSIAYCQEAMEHLREIATVVYIRLEYQVIKSRLGDIRQRGVILREGQGLEDLYKERCPLYEKYADIIVEAGGLNMEQVMEAIAEKIKGTGAVY